MLESRNCKLIIKRRLEGNRINLIKRSSWIAVQNDKFVKQKRRESEVKMRQKLRKIFKEGSLWNLS